MATKDQKLAHSIAEFAQLSGLGRSFLYEQIALGRLPVRKAGRRTARFCTTRGKSGSPSCRSPASSAPALQLHKEIPGPSRWNAMPGHRSAFECFLIATFSTRTMLNSSLSSAVRMTSARTSGLFVTWPSQPASRRSMPAPPCVQMVCAMTSGTPGVAHETESGQQPALHNESLNTYNGSLNTYTASTLMNEGIGKVVDLETFRSFVQQMAIRHQNGAVSRTDAMSMVGSVATVRKLNDTFGAEAVRQVVESAFPDAAAEQPSPATATSAFAGIVTADQLQRPEFAPVGVASAHSVLVPATFPANWDPADAPPADVTDSDLSLLLVEAKLITAAEGPCWPAVMPITSTLPPVEPFIPELLPDAIRDYVLDVADRQQAPPDFAAVTALCGLAAVIGNRCAHSSKAER